MIPLLFLLSVGLVYGAESPRLSSSDKSPREHKVITVLKKQAQQNDNSTDIPRLNAQMVRGSTTKQGLVLGSIFYGATKAIAYGAIWAGSYMAVRKLTNADTRGGITAVSVDLGAGHVAEQIAHNIPKGAGYVATTILATETGREAVYNAGTAVVGSTMAVHGTSIPVAVTAVNTGIEAAAMGAWKIGCMIPWL